MSTPYTVALVVDPAFGEGLLPLAERVHVWAVESPENRRVAERIWAESDAYKDITTFEGDPQNRAERSCSAIIDTLDIHHDEYGAPGYTVLEVYGARATEGLKRVFREYDFNHFQTTNYGFIARKDKP